MSIPAGSGDSMLIATIIPSNASDQSLSWYSSDAFVASVNLGNVTPLSAGTTAIVVSSNDGMKADTCLVTVTAGSVAVSGINVYPNSMNLEAGGANGTITASIFPANATNRNVVWSSSDASVASVANGVVTPLLPGIVSIRATASDGGYSSYCQVTVLDSVIPVTGVEANPDTIYLTVGGPTASIVHQIEPSTATNRNVYWTSSDNNVATVSKGVVSPVTSGSANITITTAFGSYTDVVKVIVKPQAVALKSISIQPSTLNLEMNSHYQLLSGFTPVDATNRNLRWTSSNNAVVQVNQNGMLTGKAIGNAIITATSQEGGFQAFCNVQVMNTSGLTEGEIHTSTLVWPNPCRDKLNIDYNSVTDEQTNLFIYSAQGMMMLQYRLEVKRGKNHIEINTSLLNKGVYLCVIEQNGLQTQMRLIVL